MFTRKKVIVASVMFAFLGTLVPLSAKALITVVPRRFPGSACVKIGTQGTLRIAINGAVYNDATDGSLMRVDCPIDGNVGGTGNSTQTLRLRYVDNSPSSLSCVYYNEDANGFTFLSNSQSSVADDSASRTLVFTIGNTFLEGYSHIQCSIPAKDSTGARSEVQGYQGY